jgi:hypothetical protein
MKDYISNTNSPHYCSELDLSTQLPVLLNASEERCYVSPTHANTFHDIDTNTISQNVNRNELFSPENGNRDRFHSNKNHHSLPVPQLNCSHPPSPSPRPNQNPPPIFFVARSLPAPPLVQEKVESKDLPAYHNIGLNHLPEEHLRRLLLSPVSSVSRAQQLSPNLGAKVIQKEDTVRSFDMNTAYLEHCSMGVQATDRILNGEVESTMHESIVTILALADVFPTKAYTLRGRGNTCVTYHKFRSNVDKISIQNRLAEWDPFWLNEVVDNISITSPVISTAPTTDLIQTATSFEVNVESYCDHITCSGDLPLLQQLETMQYSLLLRMLPFAYEPYAKKRADNHLWPKGTFLQIFDQPTVLCQRKQQKFNPKDWRFMSKELNLAPFLTGREDPGIIDIFCHDEQRFIICVSLSRKRTVDEILEVLLDPTHPEKIHSVSCDEGIRRAIALTSSLVCIDLDADNDGKDNVTNEIGKSMVSLLCPISKKMMKIPVRGKKCLHLQVRETTSLNIYD